MATGSAMMIKMDSSSSRATPVENYSTPQTPQSSSGEPANAASSAPTISTAAPAADDSRFGWWGRRRRQRAEPQSSTSEAARPSSDHQQVPANPNLELTADQAATGNDNSNDQTRISGRWDVGNRFWRYGPLSKRGPAGEDFGDREGDDPSPSSVESGPELLPPFRGRMGNFRGPYGRTSNRFRLFKRGGGPENGYFFREFDFVY